MALKPCVECKKEVSTEAKVCPHCGVKNPTRPKPTKKQSLISFLFFAVIFGVLAVSCSSGKKDAGKGAAQACSADDLQCLGDKGLVSAGVYCKRPIESLAKNSMKWTDGTFDMKFSRFRWKDKANGTITYIGDKAQFQNGFGANVNVIYECDLSRNTETVLDARVREGRLPR